MNFATQNRTAMNSYASRQSVNPPGFAGTLTPEQRQRMIAALTPGELTAYQAMSPANKTVFEGNYADAHWDVISGTVTPAQQQAQTSAYLHTTEQALGMTFGAISTAIANGNQQRLAEISAQNQQALATIQAQLDRDTGNGVLRAQYAALQNTQMLLDQQRNQTAQTYTYIAAAAVLLALGGLYVWSQQSRKNPVVERSGHRMFIPLELLPKSEQAEWRREHPRRRHA